ncbi:MAG: hypothetical protein IT577_15235 [Verrucomicrobiae bacterium]|nr:hypothetical protein [Verrucomicrobiae bacterium]
MWLVEARGRLPDRECLSCLAVRLSPAGELVGKTSDAAPNFPMFEAVMPVRRIGFC